MRERPATLPGATTPPAKPEALPGAMPAKPAPVGPRWYEASPLLDWFLRRHLLVQIGLAVLFIGVAFLLKYAADQGWLSIEARHLAVAAGALVLGGVGWRLRGSRRTYGLALQGGSLGILYLTTFSAYRVYDLLPATAAFGIFFVSGCSRLRAGRAQRRADPGLSGHCRRVCCPAADRGGRRQLCRAAGLLCRAECWACWRSPSSKPGMG